MKNKSFLKGAIAGLVMVIVVSSGLALAANPFTDVPSGQFYADPVDWAYNNGITTGSPAGSTTFKPDDPVTRGENITFAKRYDDNVVQPALTELGAADQKVYWIWFGGTGVKAGGSDGVTSMQTGTGAYTVDFDGVDITGCSWSAVHRIGGGFFIFGGNDTMISLQQGFTGLLPVTIVPDVMYVAVFDETGTAQDAATQVQVIC